MQRHLSYLKSGVMDPGKKNLDFFRQFHKKVRFFQANFRKI